jgi:hypothetical protein
MSRIYLLCVFSVLHLAFSDLALAGDIKFLRERSFSCSDIANGVNQFVAMGEQDAVKEMKNLIAGNRKCLASVGTGLSCVRG